MNIPLNLLLRAARAERRACFLRLSKPREQVSGHSTEMAAGEFAGAELLHKCDADQTCEKALYFQHFQRVGLFARSSTMTSEHVRPSGSGHLTYIAQGQKEQSGKDCAKDLRGLEESIKFEATCPPKTKRAPLVCGARLAGIAGLSSTRA